MQKKAARTPAPALEAAGEAAGECERRHLLRCFWRGAGGFWGRRGKPVAWVLSAALLLIVLLNLAASYGMNVWHRVVFDALQEKDSATVLLLSALYLPLLAASVSLSVVHVCARMTMQRRWRGWLNNLLVDRWLRNARYYQLDLTRDGHAVVGDLRTAVRLGQHHIPTTRAQGHPHSVGELIYAGFHCAARSFVELNLLAHKCLSV